MTLIRRTRTSAAGFRGVTLIAENGAGQGHEAGARRYAVNGRLGTALSQDLPREVLVAWIHPTITLLSDTEPFIEIMAILRRHLGLASLHQSLGHGPGVLEGDLGRLRCIAARKARVRIRRDDLVRPALSKAVTVALGVMDHEVLEAVNMKSTVQSGIGHFHHRLQKSEV